jgi:hypothetical protein
LEYSQEKSWVLFESPFSKFSIVPDGKLGGYWAVSNKVVKNSPAYRTRLVLSRSADVRNWGPAVDLVIHNGDPEKVGIQYPDAIISGDDLLVVTRSALNGAPNFHDANMLLFHRFKNFRETASIAKLTLPDRPPSVVAGRALEFTKNALIEIPLKFANDPEEIQVLGLPQGVRYDAALLSLVGIATTPGKHTIQVVAVNAVGRSMPISFDLVIREN